MNNVNVGTVPNDDTGDKLRDAFIICNDNFTEIGDYLASNDTTISSIQEALNNIPVPTLDNVISIGATTSQMAYFNGGLTSIKSYAYAEILTPYYNDMSRVAFNVSGDDTDYPTTQGANLTLDPENGFSIAGYNSNSYGSVVGSPYSISLNYNSDLGYKQFSLSDYGIMFYVNTGSSTLNLSLLTNQRTHTLPDKNGTFAMISDITSFDSSSIVKQTVTNGVTSSCPSQDAVYDYIASATASISNIYQPKLRRAIFQLTQTGTSAPVISFTYLNTTGESFSFTRQNVGQYRMTPSISNSGMWTLTIQSQQSNGATAAAVFSCPSAGPSGMAILSRRADTGALTEWSSFGSTPITVIWEML